MSWIRTVLSLRFFICNEPWNIDISLIKILIFLIRCGFVLKIVCFCQSALVTPACEELISRLSYGYSDIWYWKHRTCPTTGWAANGFVKFSANMCLFGSLQSAMVFILMQYCPIFRCLSSSKFVNERRISKLCWQKCFWVDIRTGRDHSLITITDKFFLIKKWFREELI